MQYPHIALVGKARAGKDSVARLLATEAAYTRLAFADRLKEVALRVDPFIPDHYGMNWRLSELIAEHGWERVKDAYPEVRRILQHVGQTMREMNSEIWITPVTTQLQAATTWNVPTVITDVRYPNEVETLRTHGAVVVRVVRPGTGAGVGSDHESETALDGLATDYTIHNDGTFAALADSVGKLLAELPQ